MRDTKVEIVERIRQDLACREFRAGRAFSSSDLGSGLRYCLGPYFPPGIQVRNICKQEMIVFLEYPSNPDLLSGMTLWYMERSPNGDFQIQAVGETNRFGRLNFPLKKLGSTYYLSISQKDCGLHSILTPGGRGLLKLEWLSCGWEAVNSNEWVGLPFPFVASATSEKRSNGFLKDDPFVLKPLPASNGPFRILVAEDNPQTQRIIKDIFQFANIDGTIVDNGESALEFLRSDQQVWNGAILDYHIKGMNGGEVARRVRANCKTKCPSIAILTRDHQVVGQSNETCFLKQYGGDSIYSAIRYLKLAQSASAG